MRRFTRIVGELYRTHFAEKLFNKILLTYSVIIMVTLVALAFFIYQYFTQYMINKETLRMQEASANVSAYIDQRMDASRMMLESIHSNESFMQYFEVLLEKGYAEFLSYQLDRYFDIDTPINASLKSLSAYFNNGFDLDSILFLGKGGEVYRVTSQLSLEIVTPSELPERVAQENERYAESMPIFPVMTNESAGRQPLYVYAAELKNPDTLKPIGQIMIQYRANGIMKSNQRTPSDLKGDIMVLTREGDVIYDSSMQWYGMRYPVERLLDSDTPKLEEQYTVSTANKAGVIVAGIMSSEQLSSGTKALQRWITIVTGLFIAVALLLTYILILRFSKRTKVIVRAMEKLDVGQWNVRIPLTKGDELYQISSNFNKMCERVNDYIEKVYVSEIKQKNAEIVAMQMQMNPHFLYNTLEAIRMNAVAQGAPEAGHMIFLLATLFRTTMKSAMIVDVAAEMERCRVYLELFQIRYPNQLQVEFDIPEELGRHEILKLSVQPLIENYVLHGFRAGRLDNLIRIEGILKQDVMILSVGDNGKGIPLPELMKLRQSLNEKSELEAKSDSLGLSNVHMRLQMVYGSEYGLTIESMDGAGTEVTLKIPAVVKE
ncbi:sensor histidine kinase [Paenibacillus sp. LHD-117]|uniref:sensor histidine kinase n=1 Tax=Paenibacillus sp. LHD-117 TaxID=3071412 RepID=UPI0027DF17B0|nr:sensor histidine kinase [Paenibacillus sp. LHD-117]MDQ6418853.1 sensor histidine kinase [Paenibacillus sp. LHD-117]